MRKRTHCFNPLYLLRQHDKITQPELQKQTGLSSRTLWKLESGKSVRPDDRTCSLIEQYFHLEPHTFKTEYFQWREQYTHKKRRS